MAASRVYRQFGSRVRVLRVERNLSQERLAEKANTSLTYLGMIGRGECNPSLLKIVRIAKAFGLSLSDLFEGVTS